MAGSTAARPQQLAPAGHVHVRYPMGRRIPKLTVIGSGTPPPLPLRPLVDEVTQAWDAKQRPQDRSDDKPRDRLLRPPPTANRADEGSA
jgi:hypothetical protein